MDHQPEQPFLTAEAPQPFIDDEIGRAAHQQHTPSVRAIAVDPERGLVLLNLVGADASVSAVLMELLRSKSGGIGFLPTLLGELPTGLQTHLTTQPGGRYTIFRSALATPGGSLNLKNWCVLLSTANLAESRRRAPVIPAQLLPPPPAPAIPEALTTTPASQPPAAPAPHYVIGAATARFPDPHALLGHLRSIGVVMADDWATAVRDLALEQELVRPIPAAGVTCWRVDGDLVKWVELVRHGIQSNRFARPRQAAAPQRRAA
jgi:hypothetical protein